MSIEASINIRISKTVLKENFRILLIEILLKHGWSLSDYGEISYLPLGDIDEFDWQRENISLSALMGILKEKEQQNELLGIVMTWQNTNIGGSFLLRKNGEISICLTRNRKIVLENNFEFTDVNWYLIKILPFLDQEGLWVEYFTYEEHV